MFFLVVAMFATVIYIGTQDIKKEQTCLYEMADGYDYAQYYDGVCFLYNYDVLGQLQLVDEEIVR